MHTEAYQFLCSALDMAAYLLRQERRTWRVVEIGSRNVNGSPRGLIEPCAWYVGVDLRPGRGVDLVADAADGLILSPRAFDLAVCAEVMEHTAAGNLICANVVRWLRPGGVLLVTCAGPARQPHGVDGRAVGPGEYYRGVSEEELATWLAPYGAALTWDRSGQDTYALAVTRLKTL